jgi:hypothetical protein
MNDPSNNVNGPAMTGSSSLLLIFDPFILAAVVVACCVCCRQGTEDWLAATSGQRVKKQLSLIAWTGISCQYVPASSGYFKLRQEASQHCKRTEVATDYARRMAGRGPASRSSTTQWRLAEILANLKADTKLDLPS